MTLARCPLHWGHDLSDEHLARHLRLVGLHDNVVADLVRDRHTAGGEHRIEGELGPLPEHVEAGLIPAEGSRDPALCRCGIEPDEAEPDLAAELLAEPEHGPQLPDHVLADELEYDELAWAQAAVDAAEAQAVADAAELGW